MVNTSGECSCTCHTGPYYACDTPGGCGSTGCGQTTQARRCVTCAVLRPDTEPRIPHHPPVCDGDRALLDRHLIEIANLHADLCNDEAPIVDQRRHERFGTAYLPGGHKHTFSRGLQPSDPLAHLGGVAPINSRPQQPTVTGSRERPIPISAATHDLKAPARVPNPTPASRDWPEDQIGHLSAATVLDQWVRDIRDTCYPGHHLPPATVDELVAWLRHRLEQVCDRHPAVDEFAGELRGLRGALRAAAGVTEARPERCELVPCKRCDMEMLFRRPDGSGNVDCVNPNCMAVLTLEEYREWAAVILRSEQVKQQQNA